MDSLRLCAAAICALALVALQKHGSASFVFLLRFAALVLFSYLLLSQASPAIEYINGLFELTGFSKYAAVIVKALAVALLTHVCASVCRDSGEGSFALCVELAGKIELFLLCVPLINELLSSARALIEWH